MDLIENLLSYQKNDLQKENQLNVDGFSLNALLKLIILRSPDLVPSDWPH